MATTPLHIVILKVSNPPDELWSIMGPTNPVLSDGYGGWQEIARPKRPARITWQGRSVFKLKLEIVFTAFKANGNVEPQVDKLHRWARSPSPNTPPRAIRLSGSGIPNEHIVSWAIASLEWGRTERDPREHHRTMQFVTLNLIEITPDEVLNENSQIQPGAPKFRTYTARRGDTLSKVAARLLGSWKRWKEIAKLNNMRDNKALKAGQKIRVPFK